MKKGFTLIELLAVIVILAIIALIAVPIILNIINDSKKQSSQRSAELYLKAAEFAIVRKNLTTELGDITCEVQSQEDHENNLEPGDLICGTTPVKVEVNGTKPNGGTIVFSNGKINDGTSLTFQNGDSYSLEVGKLVLDMPKEPTDASCFTYVTETLNYYEGFDETKCKEAIIDAFIDLGAPQEYINSSDGQLEINRFCSSKEGISAGANLYGPSIYSKLLEHDALTGVQMEQLPGAVVTGYTCSDKDVIIPNTLGGKNVTEIGAVAFIQKELTSVVIPNTVTKIDGHAFYYNKLTSIKIPNSVTTIGEEAFYGNQISRVTLGNGLTTIEYGAFKSNQLTSVTIPNSVKEIGEGAFSYNLLTSLKLGDGLTTIGASAFDANKITELVIPNSVTSIGDDAFGCSWSSRDIGETEPIYYGPNFIRKPNISWTADS